MTNLNRLLSLTSLAIFSLFASCEKQENTTIDNELSNTEVSQEILNKIESLAFNTNGVYLDDFILPDGTSEKRYIVEDHIALSEDYINTMELNGGVQSEQYRTNNLVADGNISVLGFTGAGFALSTSGRNGLSFAVDNYNSLNLDISMTLSFGSENFENFDIVVFDNSANESGPGGSAGFPSGGSPNQFVQIFGLQNASDDLNEHVISHEIGHSIGFRHTDWFSRQSCGGNTTNEGTAGVGAVAIPGTPTGFDASSFMVACFSGSEDGEFNNNDITALRFLY